MVTGDVLFFNWGQGEGLSHAVIQVGIGTDPNLYPNQVWYGNYIDEHTNNRKHAFWSLKPYNADWKTTTTDGNPGFWRVCASSTCENAFPNL